MNTQINENNWIPVERQLPPAPMEVLDKLLQPEAGWEKHVLLNGNCQHTTHYKPVNGIMPKNPWVMRYFTGNEKTGYKLSPPWLRELQPRRMPPAPKNREETVDQTIKRMTEGITKEINLNLEQLEPLNAKQRFRKLKNYTCIGTTHHRAFFVKDLQNAPKYKAKWNVSSLPLMGDPHVDLIDPDAHLALKRLWTLTKGKEENDNKVLLEWNETTLWMRAQSSDLDAFGTEEMNCKANCAGSVCLDPAYLEPVLGFWPLRIYVSNPESAVSIMPATKQREFLYVVMPVRVPERWWRYGD
jgi:hypothetical protein